MMTMCSNNNNNKRKSDARVWFLSGLNIPPGSSWLGFPLAKGRGAICVTPEWQRLKDKLQSSPERYSRYRQKCRERMRLIRLRKKTEKQGTETDYGHQ
ncbi:hypothetical protein ACOMHN_022961 [Nucella lapillus]